MKIAKAERKKQLLSRTKHLHAYLQALRAENTSSTFQTSGVSLQEWSGSWPWFKQGQLPFKALAVRKNDVDIEAMFMTVSYLFKLVTYLLFKCHPLTIWFEAMGAKTKHESGSQKALRPQCPSLAQDPRSVCSEHLWSSRNKAGRNVTKLVITSFPVFQELLRATILH